MDPVNTPDPVISVLPGHRPLRSGLNLALQGGGAHGAFTWGVLDCLLERAPFQIDGVSGTSAGAVNAVALAAGFMEDGPEGARRKLEEVWRAVSRSHDYRPMVRRLHNDTAPAPAGKPSAAHLLFRAMTRVFSPYEFNPLEIDPLRVVLNDHIDFAALRKHAPMALFINATDAQSGRGRIFTGDEISIDAVLASACLPALRQAVKIGERFYWDGGFSSNPPILPLIEKCRAADTMIVRLTPERSDELPTRVNEIQGKVNHIMFSQPLRREIEMIDIARRMASSGVAVTDGLAHRMRGHRFHLLDGTPFTSELRADSQLMPDWDVLAYLNHSGRTATLNWLKRHRKAVGRRSTVDLVKKFL
ncbi:MAG: patatin-like phospholipase family protein [Rhodospirillales bacterium]